MWCTFWQGFIQVFCLRSIFGWNIEFLLLLDTIQHHWNKLFYFVTWVGIANPIYFCILNPFFVFWVIKIPNFTIFLHWETELLAISSDILKTFLKKFLFQLINLRLANIFQFMKKNITCKLESCLWFFKNNL